MIVNQVREFHEVFGHPIAEKPLKEIPAGLRDLRYLLIREELEELGEAIDNDDVVEAADALGDIAYVIYGAAIAFGGDIDSAMEMTKALAPEIVARFNGDDNPILTHFGRNISLAMLYASMEEGTQYALSALATIQLAVEAAARRFQIPLKEVVSAIHESNMSKLGEDGKPIFITEGPLIGKVVKGPNYKTPTEDIKRILGVLDENVEV